MRSVSRIPFKLKWDRLWTIRESLQKIRENRVNSFLDMRVSTKFTQIDRPTDMPHK